MKKSVRQVALGTPLGKLEQRSTTIHLICLAVEPAELPEVAANGEVFETQSSFLQPPDRKYWLKSNKQIILKIIYFA